MLWLLLLAQCVLLAVCERNAAEEAICQPFLTSKSTSPLIRGLKRDLAVDEEGDFACNLVLQDEALPLQIRVTIHEGLAWLAVRHCEMGVPEHGLALYHWDLLARMLPKVAVFSHRAGLQAMDPQLADHTAAVRHLHNLLRGAAAADAASLSDLALYEARREFARALGYLGRHSEAAVIYGELLAAQPGDLPVAFLLQQSRQAAARLAGQCEGEPSAVPALYEAIAAQFHSDYESVEGGVKEFSAEDYATQLGSLARLVEARQPFVVRFGAALDSGLGWSTARWSLDELQRRLPPSERFTTELFNSSCAACPRCQDLMGPGPTTQHRAVTFAEFRQLLETQQSGHTAVLGAQEPGSLLRGYSPLLLPLAQDIPQPALLRELRLPPSSEANASAAAVQLTEVSLWLGLSRAGSRGIASRLRADAADRLEVLIRGQKSFQLLPPGLAGRARTVLPAYYAASNGLALRHGGDGPLLASDRVLGQFSLLEDLEAAELAAVTVELRQGDMLFLPAGWLRSDTAEALSVADLEHMALSYSWRPPLWADLAADESRELRRLHEALGASDRSEL